MASTLVDFAWLTVALPFGLAALVALFGRRLGGFVALPSLLAPLTVLAVGTAGIVRWFESGAEQGTWIAAASTTWLSTGGDSALGIGFAVDGMTALMLVVVGFVATMVMIFSMGYMAQDEGFNRYYALLALFTGSMSTLVIADGLLGLFVGWELVGACSYLLIGFWFHKPSAAAAAAKAFLTTRVGDVGLLLGIALLWASAGTLRYQELFPAGAEGLSTAVVTTIALLLFVGAAGKSAQFPLHVWLPDAMEGPTPVSALIHAATMVAAGVFLIARTWPLFEASPAARAVILGIGVFTALAAATIAVAQTDIKRVLAYSTISQLGFMFAALGAGAWVVALFHLVTHAAFKALLFLGSGSVIHGTETQDMREMGGLRKSMPYTTATWIIGAAALAGVPPLAGFFSKDEVIRAVWEAQPIAAVALLIASALTAFYITRATMLTFFGAYRGHGHAHEGGWSMRGPLIALAVPAVLLGLAASPIAELLGEHGESLDPLIAGVSILVALGGVGIGWFAYRDGAASEVAMEGRLGSAWPVLQQAYGFDGFVKRAIVTPVVTASAFLYRIVDRALIDAAVEGVARLVSAIGGGVRRLQYGDAQWYAALMGAGLVVLFVLTLTGPQWVEWANQHLNFFAGGS